jgi:hypothetical protein
MNYMIWCIVGIEIVWRLLLSTLLTNCSLNCQLSLSIVALLKKKSSSPPR